MNYKNRVLYQHYTGGYLNKILNKYKINTINRSISVSQLTKKYKTEKDLFKAFQDQSKRPIELLAYDLYQAQIKDCGKAEYDLGVCYHYIYNLFIYQTTKGFNMEDKLVEELRKYKLQAERVDSSIDNTYAVDLVVKNGDDILYYIQLKPVSYKYTDSSIKNMNLTKNANLQHPVLYVYYNDKGEFENLKELVEIEMLGGIESLYF